MLLLLLIDVLHTILDVCAWYASGSDSGIRTLALQIVVGGVNDCWYINVILHQNPLEVIRRSDPRVRRHNGAVTRRNAAQTLARWYRAGPATLDQHHNIF